MTHAANPPFLIAACPLSELIAERVARLAELPLFEFLKRKEIDPLDRLSWVPLSTPLVMNFADMWRHLFRRDNSSDPIQRLVNQHTYEDEHHSNWLPIDIQSLGLHSEMDFAQTLRFVWGQDTAKARRAGMVVAKWASHHDPIVLLATIGALEFNAQQIFTATHTVCEELRARTGMRYPYWGKEHFESESKSTRGGDVIAALDDYPYTPVQHANATAAVNQVCDAFEEFYAEMLHHAMLKHAWHQVATQSPESLVA
jgi:hypothetical protein